MSVAKGSKSVLGFIPESTFGTQPAGNLTGFGFSSESLDESMEAHQSDEIRPDRSNPTIRGGNLANAGSISADWGIHRWGVWMEHLLAASHVDSTVTPAAFSATGVSRGDYVYVGTDPWRTYVCVLGGTVTSGDVSTGLTHTSGRVTISGGTQWEYVRAGKADMYKYVITGGATMPTGGLSIEKQILGGTANRYLTYLGCRLDSLDIQIPQSGIVKATWNVLGLSVNSRASSPSTINAVVADVAPTGFETFVSLNSGATVRPIQSASIRITNSIDGSVYYLHERDRRDLPEGRRVCSGNVSTYFQDATEYDLFKAETAVPLAISWIRNGCFAKFDFGSVRLTGAGSPKVGGSGAVMMAYDWTAMESTDDDVKYTLVTTESALR